MARRVKQAAEPTKQTGYTAAWYDYRRGEVCLKSWDSDVSVDPSIECIPFDWYFCLKLDDWDMIREARTARKQIDEVITEYREDGDYMRLFMPYYSRNRDDVMGRHDLIGWLRERGIEPMEADVDPVTRFLSDHPVEFSRPRVMWFDFENVPLGWVPDAKGGRVPDPNSRILSVAFANSNWCPSPEPLYQVNGCDPDDLRAEWEKRRLSREKVKALDEYERVCLTGFLEQVGMADLLVAWNGDGHDEPLLKARCRTLGLRPDWRMINFLDYMALFKHPYYGFGRDTENKGVKVSYRLENIAQTVLGDGKVDGVPGMKIVDIWERDPDLLDRYNRQDVRIMVRLEEAKGFLGAFMNIAHMCNRFPSSRAIKAGYSNDGFLLRYGSENNVRFPTKQNVDDGDDREDDKILGAFVMDPVIGLHDGVVGIDFGSLYPNIIRTFNISPEVCIGTAADAENAFGPFLNGYCLAPNGVAFSTNKTGIVSAIVEKTMAMRKKYRDRFHELENAGDDTSDEYKFNKNRSDGWKVVGNSMYGLLASPYSRVYDPRCGEAVTVAGRVLWCLTAMSATDDPDLRADLHKQLLDTPEGRSVPYDAKMAIADIVEEQKSMASLKVVAGDTDSIYVMGHEEEARRFIEQIIETTDRWVEKSGGMPGHIRLDIDAVFLRVLWVAKKRYVARRKGSEIPYVKGLEWVRTDGCQAQRDIQADLFAYLLWEPDPTPQGAERIIRSWTARLANGQIPIEKLVLTVGLAKDVDDYKAATPPIQARIAKMMIEAGREVYPGMKIPYVVMKEPKEGPIEAVHVDDCGGKYDAEHYWSAKLYPATQKLLDAAFPKRNLLWKRLGKLMVNRKQPDLFEPAPEVGPKLPDKIMLRFRPEDEGKLTGVAEVVGRWPGSTPLEVTIEVDGAVVVLGTSSAGVKVEPCNQVIDAIEEAVGHRVYYGGVLPDAKTRHDQEPKARAEVRKGVNRRVRRARRG